MLNPFACEYMSPLVKLLEAGDRHSQSRSAEMPVESCHQRAQALLLNQ